MQRPRAAGKGHGRTNHGGETMAEKIRDHLANERTFLAWVRTALGLIGMGFVLARMGLFLREMAANHLTGPGARQPVHSGHEFMASGVVFLLVGTVLAGWSGWAYRRNRLAIETDHFEPARGSIVVLAGVVVLGGLVVVGLVLRRTLGAGGP